MKQKIMTQSSCFLSLPWPLPVLCDGQRYARGRCCLRHPSLDPAVSSDNYDWRQIYPSYDRLVKYKVIKESVSTEIEPMAANRGRSLRTATWTIKIRRGIKFDDGTPLDAKAVKFSFDRVIKIGKGPADNIGSIKTIDLVTITR